MAATGGTSKNARTSSSTQRFYCPCGGEVKMHAEMVEGKVKNFATCDKCQRRERRPNDFKDGE